MSKAAELANLIGNINMGGGGVNRNVIINGAMNVAQRGTSHTGLGGSTGAVYTLDRFCTFDSATAGRATITQDSSAPSGFANSLKVDCTTADTSIAAGEIFLLSQRVEGQNLQAFAKGTSDAKPFTLSFYAKANASKTYVAELYDIDNNRHVGKTFTVGTDWARHEITFPADTTGAFGDDANRSLDVSIWLHGGSTYTGGTLGTVWQANDDDDRAAGIGSFFDSTDNTFFITGWQLEVGQNATEFEREPFDVTLNKCHRYFEEIPYASGSYIAIAYAYTSSSIRAVEEYKVKRTTPSFTFANQGDLVLFYSGSTSDVPASISYSDIGVHGCRIAMNLTDVTTTAGYAVAIYNNGGSTYSVFVDAEL